jgi:hypothetical protein
MAGFERIGKMTGKQSRRILMIGGEGVGVFVKAGMTVTREKMIPWSLPNFDQQLMRVLTASHASKAVTLLFDAGDQTYRKEGLPKMGALDKNKMIKRKLEQAFPNYPIKASFDLTPSGRGLKAADQPAAQYLFAAISETEHITKISDCLLEAGNHIAGFGLLPVESSGLTSLLSDKLFGLKMGKKSMWSIMIGQHETGGLRQVAVKNGELALTRLTPLSEENMSGEAWVLEVEREFKTTMGYISRFGFNPQDGLDVIVLGGEVEKRAFAGRAFSVSNFSFLTVREAAKVIGLNVSDDIDHYADCLHAGYVGGKSKLTLPVPVSALEKIAGPRRFAEIATIGLALGALGLLYFLYAGYSQVQTTRVEIESLRNQKNLLQREYEQESKIFDALPVKAESVRATIETRQILDANSHTLSPFLGKLETNMDPEMRLMSLAVNFMPGKEFPFTGSGGAAPAAAGASGGIAGAPQEPKHKNAHGFDKGEAVISFAVGLPATMTLEEKVKRGEDFLVRLKQAFPAHEVRMIVQFENVERQGQFGGTTGPAGETTSVIENKPAEFEIKGAPL